MRVSGLKCVNEGESGLLGGSLVLSRGISTGSAPVESHTVHTVCVVRLITQALKCATLNEWYRKFMKSFMKSIEGYRLQGGLLKTGRPKVA